MKKRLRVFDLARLNWAGSRSWVGCQVSGMEVRCPSYDCIEQLLTTTIKYDSILGMVAHISIPHPNHFCFGVSSSTSCRNHTDDGCINDANIDMQSTLCLVCLISACVVYDEYHASTTSDFPRPRVELRCPVSCCMPFSSFSKRELWSLPQAPQQADH